MRKTITKKELKSLAQECLLEYYQREHAIALMEDAEKDGDMVYAEGAQLPDASDQILAKFPTLKHALIRLHSDDWQEFVQGVEWVSPRPTIFRIKLTNGQDYTLQWMGKDFEAEISGKKYYIGQLTGYQQALNKLAILYQEGPLGQDSEEGEGGEGGSGDEGGGFGGGGGAGDFPGGEEGDTEGGNEGEEKEGGEDSEEEEGGEDMGGQDIDFEADDSI